MSKLVKTGALIQFLEFNFAYEICVLVNLAVLYLFIRMQEVIESEAAGKGFLKFVKDVKARIRETFEVRRKKPNKAGISKPKR